MGELPMPGGWWLSTAWLPMCGQTWLAAAVAFTAMWAVTMTPMMLPSLSPALWSHWSSARRTGEAAPVRSTLLIGAAYCFAWTMLGTIAFAVGSVLATAVIGSTDVAHSVPVCSGVIVALAGAVQFTPWKAHRIRCCASLSKCVPADSAHAGGALKHGFALALHSGYCCANLMAVLFAFGVMDLRAMTAVTVAMTLEQWAPMKGRMLKSIGLALVAAGAFLVMSAVGLR